MVMKPQCSSDRNRYNWYTGIFIRQSRGGFAVDSSRVYCIPQATSLTNPTRIGRYASRSSTVSLSRLDLFNLLSEGNLSHYAVFVGILLLQGGPKMTPLSLTNFFSLVTLLGALNYPFIFSRCYIYAVLPTFVRGVTKIESSDDAVRFIVCAWISDMDQHFQTNRGTQNNL